MLALAVGVSLTASECGLQRATAPCVWDNLQVFPSTSTLNPGETVTVQALRYHGNTRCEFATAPVWIVSDPQIATVTRAPVRGGPAYAADVLALRGGVAQITATDAGALAVMDLTVSPATITISPSPVTVAPAQSAVVTALLKHTDGSAVSLPVTWSILNTNVATVSASGQNTATVMGVASGTTQLSATAVNKVATATVTVSGAVRPTFVAGRFLNWDGSRGLGGMSIAVGPARVSTDANGDYSANVTPGGTMSGFAQGVCDLDQALCNQELSWNSSESETLQVPPGANPHPFDFSAQRGYHLRITGGAADQSVAPGAQFQVRLDYHTWNRAGLPGAAPWIVVGIDGSPEATHAIGVPGPHTAQTSQAVGQLDETLTAPGAGTYGVYVVHAPTSTSQAAETYYTDRFPTLRAVQFIKVFTLRVCAAAPNCP